MCQTLRGQSIRGIAAAFLLLVILRPVSADQWVSPSTRLTTSANGRFVAVTVPSDGRRKPSPACTAVFDFSDRTFPKPMFAMALQNPVAPVSVRIADDGWHLLTMDDWYGTGYGPQVLAFYAGPKLVKKYTMDELVKQGVPLPKHRSVSSISWRNFTFECFEHDGKTPVFCMYFISEKTWVAWDLGTGAPIKPGKELDQRLRQRLRQYATDVLASSKDNTTYDALYILDNLHEPQDRKALAAQLANPAMSGTSSGPDEPLYFHAYSNNRRLADESLAKWDRSPTDTGPWKFALGSLDTVIRLPAPPKLESEKVYIYLIPAEVAEDRWQTSGPYQQTSLWLYKGNHAKATDNFTYKMDTLLPGKYWMKVIYHRGDSPSLRFGTMYTPKEGDFESVGREIFEIVANESTKFPAVVCNTPVRSATLPAPR